MTEVTKLPPDTFIMNEKNRGFLDGTSRKFGGRNTLVRAIQFAAVLYISTALPIGTLLGIVFSFITSLPFITIFTYEAVLMLLGSAAIGYFGYRLRNKMEATGVLLTGEVASYDTRATFSKMGYRISARLRYWFLSPTGRIVYGYSLLPPQSSTHLPDGREFPQTGTPIAVLYLDDKRHTIL